MPVTKEELQERAQLVRVYEAACQIAHPSDFDCNFRYGLEKKIGVAFGLKEVQAMVITGPGRPQQKAPAGK